MSKDMKRRGQKEYSKQGDKTKQIYIHNKTCNDKFKILLWFYIVRKIVLCVCVCVWLTQLKLQKGLNNKSVLFMSTTYFQMVISSCGLKQLVFPRLEKVS